MGIVFSRSLRSIEMDGHRRSTVIFAGVFLLAALWTAWFVAARVAVLEVAETARLEVDQSAHSLEATVAGKVTKTSLVLGAEVHAGDVLVELDAEPLRLLLGQERAKQAATAQQLAAIANEIAAEERAIEEQKGVVGAKLDEANARMREAEAAATFADTELARATRLRVEGLASESDAQKAKADAEQKRAAAEGLRFASTRTQAERRADETERRAKIARLQRDIALLDGQKTTSEAMVKQLDYDIERRLIRAPIDGSLGEVAPVRVGGVVKEGDKLGAILPQGNIRIVAEYLPAAAVGRIAPGQIATMRPDGFPWTQYGTLSAVVSRVAHEPRSGRIRVELAVRPQANSKIPLTHGLPGTLEVEVERVSPAALVVRTAGRRLATPARSSPIDKENRDSAPARP